MRARLLILSFIIILIFCACSRNGEASIPSTPNTKDQADGQLLYISTQWAEESTKITANQLGENYSATLWYINRKDAEIQIGGQSVLLEDALRDGSITLEEICAWARIDARNGFCQLTQHTINGVTKFIYKYPEFQLEEVYDVYQTPDGKEHIISEVSILDPNAPQQDYFSIQYWDEKGQRIDREDWGIEFSVMNAAAHSITLQTVQAGGQQIGTLSVDTVGLLYDDSGRFYQIREDVNPTMEFTPDQIPIVMEGTGEFTIEWESLWGKLPPGEYTLWIVIGDIYDPGTVHPLMRNYWDYQNYQVPFLVK